MRTGRVLVATAHKLYAIRMSKTTALCFDWHSLYGRPYSLYELHLTSARTWHWARHTLLIVPGVVAGFQVVPRPLVGVAVLHKPYFCPNAGTSLILLTLSTNEWYVNQDEHSSNPAFVYNLSDNYNNNGGPRLHACICQCFVVLIYDSALQCMLIALLSLHPAWWLSQTVDWPFLMRAPWSPTWMTRKGWWARGKYTA